MVTRSSKAIVNVIVLQTIKYSFVIFQWWSLGLNVSVSSSKVLFTS